MTFWVQAGLALIDSVVYYFHDFDTVVKRYFSQHQLKCKSIHFTKNITLEEAILAFGHQTISQISYDSRSYPLNCRMSAHGTYRFYSV